MKTQAFLHKTEGKFSVMIVLDVDDNTKKKIEDLRDVNALYQNQKWALFFSTKVVNFHGHAEKAFMFFFSI